MSPKLILFAVAVGASSCAADTSEPIAPDLSVNLDRAFCENFATGFAKAGALPAEVIQDFTQGCVYMADHGAVVFGPFPTYSGAFEYGSTRYPSGAASLDSARGWYYFFPDPYDKSSDGPCLVIAGEATESVSITERDSTYSSAWIECSNQKNEE